MDDERMPNEGRLTAGTVSGLEDSEALLVLPVRSPEEAALPLVPVVQPHEGHPPVPARIIGRELYARLRGQNPTPETTIRAMVQALIHRRTEFPPTAPPASFPLLVTWAQEEAWERVYEARLVNRLLASPTLALATRLETALRLRDTLRHKMDEASVRVGTPETTAAEQAHYTTLWKMYREAGQDLERVESDVARATASQMSTGGQEPRWKTREAQIAQSLVAEYGGNGPVYELLCRRLAEVTVRLEQLRESTASMDTNEYVKLVQLQTGTVAQLQRYTEATKTETVSKEVKEVGLGIMREAEKVLGTRYPELYNEFVEAVRERLQQQSHRDGPPPSSPPVKRGRKLSLVPRSPSQTAQAH